MIDLTIIIPHYNTPLQLEKLIQSINVHNNVQIIVVDDNSTDNLGKLESVRQKYSSYVEFYCNKTGIQSAGACRNTGLKHAKGKWLMFADADDFFIDSYYDTISKYFNSEFDQIIFNVTSQYSDTGEIATRHLVHARKINDYLGNPSEKNYYRVIKRFAPWGKMIRRAVVEENNIIFSETLHSNDQFFSTQVSYYCKQTVIDGAIIYCITRGKNSLTTVVSKTAYMCHVNETIKCYCFSKNKYSKKVLGYFNYNALLILYDGLKRGIDIKTLLWAFIKLVKGGIPLITCNYFNPIFVYTELTSNKKRYGKDRKFFVEK
ncbi:glycosyltransferase family 2 protein [Butyrivibrio sp. YAB3001]|uniref:glycosyltransferase family 2 protein n=1 Tax=Butyrivibrio sp. YAB3001 TaxID=1520812 RepID=UPI0008F68F70|nr:glycosyltransferase family 2 protein [Butyrivibrio sp. YAB3001]SFD00281.1 Glycosyl transferase family 2 [Butyrivibrio sp. YAB3001]